MSYNSKYTGEQVEEILDAVANGEAGGGGGGITVETDPVFSASPAASITEAKKAEWDNKVDKVSGKQLSTNDFTNEYRSKLDGIDDRVQSDWAQGDVANASYIKNRTHYASVISYVGEFVTVSKEVGDVLCEGLSIGGIYTIINQTNTVNRTMFQFVVGRKINIPFNGPTVEALCSENGSLVLASSTGGIVQSFSVHYTEAKQLDDVYIPETIARKTEIATINGQSLTEGGDITIQGNGGAVDNVYITDFKVVDFELLKGGKIEELQIDSVALSEAIIAKKTILVPYDDGYVGGYSLLLGEVVNTDIYFSVYTHQAWVYYCEVLEGVIYGFYVYAKDLTVETVQQTNLDTLKNIALANAVQTDGLLYALPDHATGDEDDVLLSRNSVKTINGESIVGSGDINISGGSGGVEPYVTAELTVEELRALAENSEYILEVYDKAAIKQALAEHRPIFVPQSLDESYVGYALMCGYYEDLLYLQVISEAGELFIIDTESVDDTPIYGNQVSMTYLRNIDESIFGTYPILSSWDSTVLSPANTYTVIVPVVSDMVDIRLEDIGRTDRTNECVVRFTVSSAAEGVELIVPDNVVWADGVLPAMTPGKAYEISFLSILGKTNFTATFLEF